MKVIINETNEVKDLTIIDSGSGCEWTADLVSDDSSFDDYDREDGYYHISQESYDFWKTYISFYEADETEEKELYETYDADEACEIIKEETENINDYDCRHDCYQKAFARIRAELTPVE